MSGPVDQPTSLAELARAMEQRGSDSMDFEVYRTPEPGKTFSKEAIEDVEKAIHAFVVARLTAAWKRKVGDAAMEQPTAEHTAPGPSRLRVDMTLTFDGQALIADPDERPWYTLSDGERRGTGMDRADLGRR